MSAYDEYVEQLKEAQEIRAKGGYTRQPGIGFGYGFGFNSLNARKSSMGKSLLYDTPHIFKENVLNNIGILTKQQRAGTRDANFIGKAFSRTAGLLAGVTSVSSAYEGEDGMDMARDLSTNIGMMTGMSTGLRVAGSLTKRKAVRVGGAVGGAATGYALAYGMTEGLRDITSSKSKIGEMAKKGYSTQMYSDHDYLTQASLTSRQKALQQLGSSALNDRGFTLGNEASILKNSSL